MSKWIMVLMFVLASAFFAFGCDSVDDLVDEVTGADEAEPCGRYCIKCTACKDQGEGYVKKLLDYTCVVDEVGAACQLACEQSGIIDQTDVQANVEKAETAAGKQITDETYSCEEFGLAVLTGEADSPCMRFCAKAVECSGETGVAYAADTLAAEGGVPCVEGCVQAGGEEYVTDFENIAKENTEGIESLSDIECDDFNATFDKVGDVPFL